MEAEKLQRLHDTLSKLAPRGKVGGLGLGVKGLKAVPPKDPTLPNNPLYANFVRAGSGFGQYHKRKFDNMEEEDQDAVDTMDDKKKSKKEKKSKKDKEDAASEKADKKEKKKAKKENKEKKEKKADTSSTTPKKAVVEHHYAQPVHPDTEITLEEEQDQVDEFEHRSKRRRTSEVQEEIHPVTFSLPQEAPQSVQKEETKKSKKDKKSSKSVASPAAELETAVEDKKAEKKEKKNKKDKK
jgi:hypothetical protein